jgi:hypothetical protein
MKPVKQIYLYIQSQNAIQLVLGAAFLEDFSSQSQTADKKVALARLSRLRQKPKAI